MIGFSSLRPARRRTTISIGLALAAIVGVGAYYATNTDTESPTVDLDFVLGGGSKVYGTANTDAGTLAIPGQYRGLASAANGTIYLFTQEDKQIAMWRKPKSGALTRVPISGMVDMEATQAAVAPDGSIYLAAGDLWRVSPTGQASKIIDTDCEVARFSPFAQKIADLCVSQVTGVAVTRKGTVYIGDEITLGKHGSYVHKLDGDAISLIAGRPPKDGESLKRSNPAVRSALNPAQGTMAKNVLVPDVWNSGWISAYNDALYWRTGPGIVRINEDGTLSPCVGAKAPGETKTPSTPLKSIGQALNAEITSGHLNNQQGDVTTIPGRQEIYYTDAGKTYSPPFSNKYRWGGSKTTSQQDFVDHLTGGKVVYRVSAGQVSPVAVGVQAVTASSDQLYIAAESKINDSDSSQGWSTAVLQVELSEGD
ncbi:hypothetical protein [Streptomyces adustus]